MLAGWITHALVTLLPYYDCTMLEKSQSGGHVADPTMQVSTVGEWGGPRGCTAGPNHPQIADSLGQTKAQILPPQQSYVDSGADVLLSHSCNKEELV